MVQIIGPIAMSKTSKRSAYLQPHGGGYRVRIVVPPDLREIVGKSNLVEQIKGATGRADALRKSYPIIARFNTILDQARAALSAPDALDREALHRRMNIPSQPPSPSDGRGYEAYENELYALEERAEKIERSHGLERAQGFYALASHKVTPLRLHEADFLQFKAYKRKSEDDFRRVLSELEGWLGQERHSAALEAITRRIAGQFISASLSIGRSAKKAKAYLGFLTEYWRWLAGKGIASADNPWVGQPVASGRTRIELRSKREKRPFTDEEVAQLLTGQPSHRLLPAVMRIAALSGMRIEEIAMLTVADCEGGTFRVREGKTERARREFPIHSSLTRLIDQLGKGAKPGDHLIRGLPDPPESRNTRSDPLSKAFTRYRRSLGIGDEAGGRSDKSEADFHSFRRWFIAKAREARLGGATGYDEWTLIDVIGHTDSERPKTLDLSQRTYAGPDPLTPRRALVEAIRLPPGVPSEPPPARPRKHHRKATTKGD